jgi:ribosome-binding ATPase YchF (GTP1/OBG family)
MIKEITATQLATQMSQIKKWLEFGVELVVVNQKSKKPFAIIKPFKSAATQEEEEVIEVSAEFEKYIIPLSQEEQQNPYVLSEKIPKGYSKKPAFRHRNQH